MKRLARISLDTLISSLTPIITWFFISVIIDKNLFNVFTLTYPLQCLSALIISIFGTGANVSKHKDKNKYASDNGIIYGFLVSFALFGFIALNSRSYIDYMHMDRNIYFIFTTYSIYQIFLTSVLYLILTKLYYEDKTKQANKTTIIFNILNFVALIGMSLITKNQVHIVMVTLSVLTIYILFQIQNIEKFNFKLNIKNCIKYDIVSVITNFMYFIIYLFGISNTFAFGPEIALAMTFSTIVTDIEWDMTSTFKTVAKIDIVKKKFDYKEHKKNDYIFTLFLILMIILTSIVLYPIYNPDQKIICVFIGIHIISFLMFPPKEIKTCYIEIESPSSSNITIHTFISNTLRTIITFIPTPFCTIFAQLSSSIYEYITMNILYKKLIKKN